MKKDSLICFRASKGLRESLAQVAREERRSLSSTIEMILTNYTNVKKAMKVVKKEKRQYPRKSIAVPAVINQHEPERLGIGTIKDLSLGGVKVLVPKDFRQQNLIEAQGSKFDIVFNLPNENKSIRLSCKSKRVVDTEDGSAVGACIVDADFKSYKVLHTYLM